jgi:uncharacterized membrane protein YeiB
MYAIKFAFSVISFLTLFAALGGCGILYLVRRSGRSPA